MKKVILINIIVTLLLISIFDVATFFLLPASYTVRFPEYRFFSSDAPHVGGRRMYPNDYFVRDNVRGFDIGRSRSGVHWVSGVTYPIWSNGIGCFDDDHTEYSRYIYFAGDSFTWGYTPFEEKFGSLIEKNSGAQILKCGVSHTGQRHQFEKLTQVVKEVGKTPRAIFVFYYSNDVANDYAHPHTTVIDGWQVDNVSLDVNYELKRHSDAELILKIQSTLQSHEGVGAKGWISRVKTQLKYYSLLINILDYSKDQFEASVSELMTHSQLSSKPKDRSIYSLPNDNDGKYWYLENPKALKNQAALIDFARFSKSSSVKLVVVLIPPMEKFNDLGWYEELRKYLTEKQIRHLDLTSKFVEQEKTSVDLYWQSDGHFNPNGNRSVADILIEEFPDIFSKKTE
jgi:hypothetical protein